MAGPGSHMTKGPADAVCGFLPVLHRAAVVVFVVLLPTLAVLILARSHAGALGDVPAPILLGLVIAVFVLGCAARWAVLRAPIRGLPLAVLFWMPTAAVAVVALGAYLGRPSPTLALGISGLIVWDGVWGRQCWLRGWKRPPATEPGAIEPAAGEEEFLRQQIRHCVLPDGTKVIEGRLSLRLEEGTRLTAAHVPFFPPFQTVPTWEVVQIGGPSVRLKSGPVFAYGVRIELRGAEAQSRDSHVELRFRAAGAGQPKVS